MNTGGFLPIAARCVGLDGISEFALFERKAILKPDTKIRLLNGVTVNVGRLPLDPALSFLLGDQAQRIQLEQSVRTAMSGA